jgi:hypothetical protein
MHTEQMSPSGGCRSLLDLRLSASILAWNVLVFPLPTLPPSLATLSMPTSLRHGSTWCYFHYPQAIDFLTFQSTREGSCIARQVEAPHPITPLNRYIPLVRAKARHRNPSANTACNSVPYSLVINYCSHGQRGRHKCRVGQQFQRLCRSYVNSSYTRLQPANSFP